MHDLPARVAYLQGLCRGMNLDTNSDEGRLLEGIVNVLSDFTVAFQEMQDSYLEMEEYLESIDEDLYQLEDSVYEGEMEEIDHEDILEVDCPGCGEVVCFEAGTIDGRDDLDIICPRCENIVFTTGEKQSEEEPGDVQGSEEFYMASRMQREE